MATSVLSNELKSDPLDSVIAAAAVGQADNAAVKTAPLPTRDRSSSSDHQHSSDEIVIDDEEEEDESKITPLHNRYSFWFHRRGHQVNKSASYEDSIIKLGTFHSVERFWRIYDHTIRPNEVKTSTDYHIFKEGVKPTWEDPVNRNGGKWMVRVKKGLTSMYWEELILAIIGEQFDVGPEVCGAVVSIRTENDIISVWNKNADNIEATNKIRDQLRRLLKLPTSVVIEYKKHQESLSDNSSYRNPTIVWRSPNNDSNNAGPSTRTSYGHHHKNNSSSGGGGGTGGYSSNYNNNSSNGGSGIASGGSVHSSNHQPATHPRVGGATAAAAAIGGVGAKEGVKSSRWDALAPKEGGAHHHHGQQQAPLQQQQSSQSHSAPQSKWRPGGPGSSAAGASGSNSGSTASSGWGSKESATAAGGSSTHGSVGAWSRDKNKASSSSGLDGSVIIDRETSGSSVNGYGSVSDAEESLPIGDRDVDNSVGQSSAGGKGKNISGWFKSQLGRSQGDGHDAAPSASDSASASVNGSIPAKPSAWRSNTTTSSSQQQQQQQHHLTPGSGANSSSSGSSTAYKPKAADGVTGSSSSSSAEASRWTRGSNIKKEG